MENGKKSIFYFKNSLRRGNLGKIVVAFSIALDVI